MTPSRPLLSRRNRLHIARLLVLTLALFLVLPERPASAGANLIANPGLESIAGDGFPVCWEKSGWGANGHTFEVSADAHSGARSMSVTLTTAGQGDRKAMMLEDTSCAPNVTPGHQYDLSAWYKSSTPNTVMTVFRHDVAQGWVYWTDLASLPVATGWTQQTVRTPQVPANTDQIVWGITIYGNGTLKTDDYTMVDATQPTPDDSCSAGDKCVKGDWQVMPFDSAVRGIHAVVLRNGDVLLIAGSGNDPDAFAAKTFKTAIYKPGTGRFTAVPTPEDLFCAGHVQLKDGRVLVMGGNKDYPAADGGHGYKGLKNSYIFDPATSAYQRVNDMTAGSWYPSATVMGNGDVISLGGLGEDSHGTVATQYFSDAQQRWLGLNEANQTWNFWGLYPSMVLMQDGRLFYSGSHVFGNGTPGSGSSIYDYQAGTIAPVPGLRKKDERDQSMSVLLPPAQDQKVLTLGGGNIETNPDAHRLTDIIDLKQPSPAYTAGPPIPHGKLTGGVAQTGDQGKMYVSAVLLPDGKVFETGGALHNRADPVFEASMYDPATNQFTPGMATDPVPRGYHSSAFLLPDGRVMAVGDNPGNGTFDMRVSVYSPPYLFQGARPQITGLSSANWAYGSANTITVDKPVLKAELIRPAAVTHSSDPNQRFVDLPMTVNGNSIDLNLTSNPNLAPPGWYMLFVVGTNGVPSVAKWVKIG
ncbi:galactose oxidase early set domain-containing protein [Actinoplanes sp. NEAU-A12]|uniref:Galactose oxidase early set domain-containing protein n=1 Tax=Actinoplanes sandaracinus TaxID=3045177 RepID=A0ABT6WQ32_9ACTN|nr:galactose oxidase early set domain-containing protein [Actinoplanes sandaracinus]MDI6101789.1 galactose oxidase early set domain-containing protein [Actinoplanes sandaracinus]